MLKRYGWIAALALMLDQLTKLWAQGLGDARLVLIPGVVGEVLSLIPIFQLGIPAILSIYFDLFTSVLQAFIFCMLTMMYIKLACEE